MSLQRDWAHVEWSADFLVPDATSSGAGVEDESKSEAEACSSSAGGEDAFVFRAVAIAEVRGPFWDTAWRKRCASCRVFCLFS